jgi:hypothetical protein
LSFCSPWVLARSWRRAGNFARRGTSSGTGCGTGCTTDSVRCRRRASRFPGRHSPAAERRDATTPPGCGATGASSDGCSTPSGGISTGVEDRSKGPYTPSAPGAKAIRKRFEIGCRPSVSASLPAGERWLGGRPADDAPPVYLGGIVASVGSPCRDATIPPGRAWPRRHRASALPASSRRREVTDPRAVGRPLHERDAAARGRGAGRAGQISPIPLRERAARADNPPGGPTTRARRTGMARGRHRGRK